MKTAPSLPSPTPAELENMSYWAGRTNSCPLCGKWYKVFHECTHTNKHLRGKVQCDRCHEFYDPGPNGEKCPNCSESTS